MSRKVFYVHIAVGSSNEDGIAECAGSDLTPPEIKGELSSAQDHWAAFHQAVIECGAITN